MTGVGIPRVTLRKLNAAILPVPPLEEQARIAARVRELLNLIARLEGVTVSSGILRKKARDARFLDLLAAESRDGSALAWHSLSTHLGAFLADQDDVHALRRVIEDMAVRGRLSSREQDDEPASCLLDRIAEEKTRHLPAGRPRRLSVHRPDDSPTSYTLPQGWVLTTCEEVFLFVADGDHQPPPKAESGVPFLVIGDISSGRVRLDVTRHVSPSYYDRLDWTRRPTRGDLLYTVTGSFGIVVRVDTDRPFCVQRHIGILKTPSQANPEFLRLALTCRTAFAYATERATGTAQKTVSLSALRAMPLPLPPLAEQNRIVSTVSRLLTTLDSIETGLAAAHSLQLSFSTASVDALAI